MQIIALIPCQTLRECLICLSGCMFKAITSVTRRAREPKVVDLRVEVPEDCGSALFRAGDWSGESVSG